MILCSHLTVYDEYFINKIDPNFAIDNRLLTVGCSNMNQAVRMAVETVAFLWLIQISLSCMITENLESTQLIGEDCFWTLHPLAFTSWQSAQEACAKDGGLVATIENEEMNSALSGLITR